MLRKIVESVGLSVACYHFQLNITKNVFLDKISINNEINLHIIILRHELSGNG